MIFAFAYDSLYIGDGKMVVFKIQSFFNINLGFLV